MKILLTLAERNFAYKTVMVIEELLFYTKHQLKTIQKIEHNLAYMDYAKIFCLWFYW